MLDFFEFAVRPRVVFRPGMAREVGDELRLMGVRRAFIVADDGVAAAGLLDGVRDGLRRTVTVVGEFTDVPANSSVAAVERGAALARDAGADLLVAVGGGSPIDTAKAMRILLTEGGALLDWQGYNLLERPLIPLVAIPTTAGTGSEVTSWAVIRDEAAAVKMAFSSPFLAPDLAVLDPELTRGLPPRLTAATGIDALVHAIESYVGTNGNPMVDGLALKAAAMVHDNLIDAVHNGANMDARANMLIASCLAGIAFSSGGGNLGIVHALAHSVGGMFEVHHGTANAIFLPHSIGFNAPAAADRYAQIAAALGIATQGRAQQAVLAETAELLDALIAESGLPTRLREVGVPRDALPAIAELSLSDAAMFTNPRQPTYDEALALLERAY